MRRMTVMLQSGYRRRQRSGHSMRIVTAPLVPASTLRIKTVRLEAAPPSAPKGFGRVEVRHGEPGIIEAHRCARRDRNPERELPDTEVVVSRVIVGPSTTRGNVSIDAGYTVNYEMLLRQFSTEYGCVANVGVVSARAVADSSP